MRRTSLILILVLLIPGIANAARLPPWALEAEGQWRPGEMVNVDAIVVLELCEIQLREGERTGVRRRLIHVETEDGVGQAATVLSSGSLDRFDKIRVWHRSPDGKVRRYSRDDGTLLNMIQQKVIDDRTLLVLRPPDVVPGSSIAMEARLFRSAELPQDLIRLQQSSPVALATIEVDCSDGYRVEGRVFGAAPALEQREAGRLRWEFRNLAGIQNGSDVHAPEPPSAILALDYLPPDQGVPFDSWNSVVRWTLDRLGYGQIGAIGESLSVSPDAPGLPDSIEAAGASARHVRYFSIALGMDGYVPRAPRTTLERGFGDCKDKAQLMVALLSAQGHEAYPSLIVAPADGYVPHDFPSPFLFNHVVVAIPWKGLEVRPGMTLVEHPGLGTLRIYDATLSRASDRDTDLRLEGAPCLVLHPSTRELVHLPTSPAEANRIARHHEWAIAADGSVAATLEVVAEGFLRSMFERNDGTVATPDDLKRLTLAVVTSLAREAEGLEVEPLVKQDDGSWTYRGLYLIPGFASEFGGLRALEIGHFLGEGLIPVPQEPEGHPTYVSVPGRWSESFDIQYPGVTYVGSGVDFDVSNSVGRAGLHLVATEDGFRLDRELVLAAREVPLSKTEELLELRSALRRLNRVVLVFE